MSITIDDVISEAWHVAAEPLDERMDVLRAKILEFSAGNGQQQQQNGAAEKHREPAKAYAADVITPAAPEAVAQPEAPEDISQQQQAAAAVVAPEPESPGISAEEAAAAYARRSVPAQPPAPAAEENLDEKKVCSRCKKEKPVTDFHRDKTVKSGRRARCGLCDNAVRAAAKAAKLEAACKAAVERALPGGAR